MNNPQWIKWVWRWKRTIYPRTKVIRDRILLTNKSFQEGTNSTSAVTFNPSNRNKFNQSSQHSLNSANSKAFDLEIQNEAQLRLSNSNYLNQLQVVDLGAGDGEFSFLWHANSFLLLDKSIENIQFVKLFATKVRKLNQPFFAEIIDLDHSKQLVKSVQKLEQATHRIFTLYSVLPYLNDPYRTLSDIGECMSQNDQLFIYLPVNQYQLLPLYRWMFERFNQYEKQNDRKHIFQTAEFLNQLTSLGFEIHYVQPVYRKWGMISHEVNSMSMMCLSHSNWGLKLLGVILLVFTWPLLQIFNMIEAQTPISGAKQQMANTHNPFDGEEDFPISGAKQQGANTHNPFIEKVDSPTSHANHLGSPTSKHSVAFEDLTLFQEKHNGLYVEVVKSMTFPGT